jgi:hypothetical protein
LTSNGAEFYAGIGFLQFSFIREAHMPETCFSYEADAPSRTGRNAAAEAAPSGPYMMITSHCFSYPADMPRRGWLACFNYSAGAPLGVGNRDALPSVLTGLRSMTFGTCFRY